MTSDTDDSASGKPVDHDQEESGEQSPDSLPSGAGPQADRDQSDIASGGGSAS